MYNDRSIKYVYRVNDAMLTNNHSIMKRKSKRQDNEQMSVLVGKKKNN